MATGKYYVQCPSVLQVKLTGRKAPWVSAKDVILKILQELSVKGGVNKIVEYTGEGLMIFHLLTVRLSVTWVQNLVPLLQYSQQMKIL